MRKKSQDVFAELADRALSAAPGHPTSPEHVERLAGILADQVPPDAAERALQRGADVEETVALVGLATARHTATTAAAEADRLADALQEYRQGR